MVGIECKGYVDIDSDLGWDFVEFILTYSFLEFIKVHRVFSHIKLNRQWSITQWTLDKQLTYQEWSMYE